MFVYMSPNLSLMLVLATWRKWRPDNAEMQDTLDLGFSGYNVLLRHAG